MSPTPQEQVMGFWTASLQFRCIAAAGQLGLPEALAVGPQSVETLAAQTRTDTANLFRLMRALETIGVFKQVSPRVFENTPMSGCLRKDVPGSLWAFIQLGAPGWGFWDGQAELVPTLRTGKTTLFDTWGYDIWEHYRRHPDQWAVFNEAMSASRTAMTPTVTAAYDWSRFPVIADVGGGIGAQLVDILNAHPGCRGVLFDLPEVVSTAIAHDRMERVSGNFFANLPVKADAYVLRSIIHDWNDERAVSILKTVRTATPPTARVMLVDCVIPDTSDFHFGKWMDITMMTTVGGRERTKVEFETLFRSAGFALEEIVPTASIFSIVVGRPAV